MPKQRSEEEIEKEKQELLEAFEDLRKDGILNEKDYNELKSMIDKITIGAEASKFKRFIKSTYNTIARFVIMYIASTLTFGFFFNDLALTNNWQLFLVALLISIPMLFLHALPWIGEGIMKKHFLLKILTVIVLFIVMLCLINSYLYVVFEFSAIWVFYVLIASVLYAVLEMYLSKKILL